MLETGDGMLEEISARIMENFDEKDRLRETGLKISREVVRFCRTAAYAIHGQDFGQAAQNLEKAGNALLEIKILLEKHADIYYAGFVEHAEQEFSEVSALYSLLREDKLPSPEALGVGYASYLNGLGDLVGELRRHILDLLRNDEPEKAEVFLGIMENIHIVLMDFDYPDAIIHGLRRKTDVSRSLIEKTRGDLTNAVQQKKLEAAMRELESRLGA